MLNTDHIHDLPEFLGPNDEVKSKQTIGDSISVRDPKVLLPSENSCGYYDGGRLIGGIRADLDLYPWLALLRYDKRKYFLRLTRISD